MELPFHTLLKYLWNIFCLWGTVPHTQTEEAQNGLCKSCLVALPIALWKTRASQNEQHLLTGAKLPIVPKITVRLANSRSSSKDTWKSNSYSLLKENNYLLSSIPFPMLSGEEISESILLMLSLSRHKDEHNDGATDLDSKGFWTAYIYNWAQFSSEK